MTRSILLELNYFDWTKSQLMERLRKLERQIGEPGRAGSSQSSEMEALKQGEHLIGPLIDALPVLISYVDSEQRYRLCNMAYEVWQGRPREALCGRPTTADRCIRNATDPPQCETRFRESRAPGGASGKGCPASSTSMVPSPNSSPSINAKFRQSGVSASGVNSSRSPRFPAWVSALGMTWQGVTPSVSVNEKLLATSCPLIRLFAVDFERCLRAFHREGARHADFQVLALGFLAGDQDLGPPDHDTRRPPLLIFKIAPIWVTTGTTALDTLVRFEDVPATWARLMISGGMA